MELSKTAWNQIQNKYEIELPSPKLVENALLKLDYPPDGIDKWEIAEIHVSGTIFAD